MINFLAVLNLEWTGSWMIIIVILGGWVMSSASAGLQKSSVVTKYDANGRSRRVRKLYFPNRKLTLANLWHFLSTATDMRMEIISQ
jgi:hypothetical protein